MSAFDAMSITGIRVRTDHDVLSFVYSYATDPDDVPAWPHRILMFGTGLELFREWAKTSTREDGQLSGVLADWVEDHLDEVRALNPHTPPYVLRLFVDTMREISRHSHRNQQVERS